jgi:hypothetical protein
VPPGVDQPELYHQRSGEVILPRSADWWDATKQLRESWAVETPVEIATPGS